MTTIIAITGRSGSGKSTVARIIEDAIGDTNNILPMAGRMKAVAFALGWGGKKDRKWRKFFQVFGTDVVRNILGKDTWVNLWLSTYNRTIQSVRSAVVIIDDVRFDNEVSLVRRKSGAKVICIEVVRKKVKRVRKHASENGISRRLIDYTIVNDYDETTLRLAIVDILKEVGLTK